MKLNRINWKKVLRLILWSQALLLLGLMMGYVNKAENRQICSEVEIKIDNEPSGIYYIDRQDVLTMLNDRALYPLGKKINEVNTNQLEALFDDHPHILNSEVYVDIKGKLTIDIKQRRAILRVINFKGEHFYLDSLGALMPVSDQYVERVPVASGNIIGSLIFTKVKEILKDEDSLTRRQHHLLDSLYMLADCIARDEFLTALIQQIYVNADHEFELIPSIGRQKIIFGTIDDMHAKFDKLLVFYQKGMVRRGWDVYGTINLKFKNQVVCTRLESTQETLSITN